MSSTALDRTPRFEAHESPAGLTVRASAALECIDAVDRCVTGYLTGTAQPVDLFAMRILVREAVLNAVTHGSGLDPGQEVRVTVCPGEYGIELTVADDGSGFAWQERRITFDILGDGGRGLALMHMYSSRMVFNERGNEVVLFRPYELTGALREIEGRIC